MSAGGRVARRLALGAVAAAALLPLAGQAQDDAVCRENAYDGRPVNPAKSDQWKMQFANRDQALMGQIAGNWYSEVSADIGGNVMVNRQIQTFEASGSYGYQDQTCSPAMPQLPCSQNQGYGRWAAWRLADGTIYVARNFSDLNRQDECAGFTAYLADPDTMLDPATGQVSMQRMQ